METFNEQFRKEIECMKQIQRNIQEIETSFKSWQKGLKETEDSLSDLEGRIMASNHKMKDLLKITREHEITTAPR